MSNVNPKPLIECGQTRTKRKHKNQAREPGFGVCFGLQKTKHDFGTAFRTPNFYFLSKVNPRWLSLMILPQAGNRQVLKMRCICSWVITGSIVFGLCFCRVFYSTCIIAKFEEVVKISERDADKNQKNIWQEKLPALICDYCNLQIDEYFWFRGS